MSWGVAGLLLAAVPWVGVIAAASIALRCRGAAARTLHSLNATAVAAAILSCVVGLIEGENPAVPIAGLVLAGVFGGIVFRSDPLGTTARMTPATAMILAVGLWNQALGEPVATLIYTWLLPALTLMLAWTAVYLHETVMPPFRFVMQRFGIFEPELYIAAQRLPSLVVRLGAAMLSVLAVVQRESALRSALVLTVAMAVNIAFVIVVVICLSRLLRTYLRSERLRPPPQELPPPA